MTKISVSKNVLTNNLVTGRTDPPIQVEHDGGVTEMVYRADLTTSDGQVVASLVYEPGSQPSCFIIAANAVQTVKKPQTVSIGKTASKSGDCGCGSK